MVAEREPRRESRRHRNTSDNSDGEDYSDYEECVEDEMPSGECSRNGRRARLPEDPWEQVSESSRVADMSEQASTIAREASANASMGFDVTTDVVHTDGSAVVSIQTLPVAGHPPHKANSPTFGSGGRRELPMVESKSSSSQASGYPEREVPDQQEACEDQYDFDESNLVEAANQPQGAVRLPLESWRDTLAKYPSLLRLYPLAASAEGTHDETEELTAFTGAEAAASTTALTENACDANGDERESRTELQNAAEGAGRAPGAAETPRTSTPRGVTTQGGRGFDAESQDHPGDGRHNAPHPVSNGYSTPGSTTSAGSWRRRPPFGARHGEPHHFNGGEAWYPSDAEPSWSDLQAMQWNLSQRERDVAQREAAVRRAEARNLATARQLSDLKRRLDEYGEELEEGVSALAAQQNALHEERRQTAEVQARARRLCAAAVRDEVLASKVREWDMPPWTPTGMMGSAFPSPRY